MTPTEAAQLEQDHDNARALSRIELNCACESDINPLMETIEVTTNLTMVQSRMVRSTLRTAWHLGRCDVIIAGFNK